MVCFNKGFILTIYITRPPVVIDVYLRRKVCQWLSLCWNIGLARVSRMFSFFVWLITTRSAQDETKMVTFLTYFSFCHMVGSICIRCLHVGECRLSFLPTLLRVFFFFFSINGVMFLFPFTCSGDVLVICSLVACVNRTHLIWHAVVKCWRETYYFWTVNNKVNPVEN